jgi:adenosylcobinamide-GDP ribazoletransferase
VDEGAVRRELGRFLATVQYFTRLPVPGFVGHDPARLEDTARYFPLVGILVGAIGAAVLVAATRLWTPPIAVALSLIAAILVTGAFHEDGLADLADGLGGSRDRSGALAIMKDSRIGVFGACALILSLLLKYVTLGSLPTRTAALALIAAHAVSRMGTVLIMVTLPYVREVTDSRSAPFIGRVSTLSLVIGSGTVVLTLVPLRLAGLVGGTAVGLVILVWRRYLARRLGGYTGDCLGAAQQIGECTFYLACAAIM